MNIVAGASRAIASMGLASVGALHLSWALGSSWPARDRRSLAVATAGSTEFPPAVPTAAVGATLAIGGVAAAGLMGDGRAVTLGRRALGVGPLGRAVLGGNRALRALGMPLADARFRRLDDIYYRPLRGLLGVAVLAARSTGRTGAAS
ncbi:MAG: DUF3995 domain-containing protein [Cumulibacter sp.]